MLMHCLLPNQKARQVIVILGFPRLYAYNLCTSGQTRPSGGSLRVLGICQLVGHRLIMPLLLRPQLVMHWLVMHALAKDSPGWPGDVSVTDLPCVHAFYMEEFIGVGTLLKLGGPSKNFFSIHSHHLIIK